MSKKKKVKKLNYKGLPIGEKILAINGVGEYNYKAFAGERYYAGIEVVTEKRRIRFLMDMEQNCCETFGCFISHDNLDNFIGADLRKIYLTDKALNTKVIDKLERDNYHEFGDVIFINLETSKGLLQWTAYNFHNGYYGHDVVVKIDQDVVFKRNI